MSPKPYPTINSKKALFHGQTIKSEYSRDITNTTVHATLNLSRSRSLSNLLRGFQENSEPMATPNLDFNSFDEKLILTDSTEEVTLSASKTEEITELVLKICQFLRPSYGQTDLPTIQMESYDELVFTSE
ncbi:hypothetical protein K7432_007375 [Basidiobolus ranarum]|uniref:Uncharacterized protein n=1 Tax=Basidiobolus ranarum TaxID=34480 RepID=A0ABR2W089_9FUNG